MSSLNTASICFGEVLHKRTKPKVNDFRYKVFYLRIPMRSRKADPGTLSKFGVGDNHFSWVSFYDRDHGVGGADALAWLEGELKKSNVTDVDGEIWLLTFPRILGYTFKPVSFWFCHNATGKLKAILAEVNNTFGDRHWYLLEPDQKDQILLGEPLKSSKAFYVSPFFNIAGHYVFRFMRRISQDDKIQNVSRIEYWLNDHLQLTTSVSGEELPLTRNNTIRAIVKFPMLTFGIILKIHWQAIKLFTKGVKFHGKPPPPKSQIN